MRRFIAFFVTIIMILGMLPKINFAATTSELPKNVVIAGDKIYSLNYMQNNSTLVNDQISKYPDKVYYIEQDGAIKDKNGNYVTEDKIVSTNGRMLTLYSTDSENGTKYVADANNLYRKISASGSNTSAKYGYALVDITKSGTTGSSVVYVKINSIYGVSNASYYDIGTGTITTDRKGIYETTSLITSNSDFNFSIYSSSGNEVAEGSVNNITSSVTNFPVLLTIVGDGSTSGSRVTGNISNNGLAASDGEFIYYSNLADGGKIYKKSINGLDEYPITEDNARYINVVGDYIYYSNLSDGGKIYKIKTDGTERTRLNNVLSSYINVVGDYIYYINGSKSSYIYLMSRYNSSVNYPVVSNRAAYLVVFDNMIYYSNLSDKGRLYSYNLNGGAKNVFTVGSSYSPGVRYISVTNDGIVYAAGFDGKLYRSVSNNRLTEVNVMANDTKKEKFTVINAQTTNDVYYRSNMLGGKLYKADSTGSGSLVYSEVITNINIAEDYIYFTKGNKLFSYKIGSTDKAVAAAKFKPDEKVASVVMETIIDSNEPLPDKVSAIMGDGSVRELLVNWDLRNTKVKNGITTYKGKVVGYGTSVSIGKARYSTMVAVDKVKVYNFEGAKADYVVVEGLAKGDIITLYDTNDKALGKATADKSGIAKITKLELDSDGGTLKIVKTQSGCAPSDALVYTYSSEAPTIVKAEYDSSSNKYRVTFTGKSPNIGYGFVSNANDNISNYTTTSGSSGVNGSYYFDIPKSAVENLVDGENKFLKIAYYSDNTLKSPSNPYTFLAQQKPIVAYNFNTSSFSGLNSLIECSFDGNNWISSQELISDKTLLYGKSYVLVRFIPSLNKMPGQIAYVPLVEMPQITVTAGSYKVFDSKDNNLFNFDELTNTLTAKYIANAGFVGTDNVKINVTTSGSSGVSYSLDINGSTNVSNSTTDASVKLTDITTASGLSTLNMVLKLKNGSEDIATQNIRVKVFNSSVEPPAPELYGVVGKAETNGNLTAYSAKVRVKYDPVLSAVVKGTITNTSVGNSAAITYNFYLNNGYWEGEEVSGVPGTYKVNINYEDNLLKPATISTTGQSITFNIDTNKTPQIRLTAGSDPTTYIGALYKSKGITDGDYKIYSSDPDASTKNILSTTTGSVTLEGFEATTSGAFEWIKEGDSRDLSKDYSFYVKYQYVGELVWHDAAQGTVINTLAPGQTSTDYYLKVVVINNKNGYSSEYIYKFTLK
ncbi:hypothetical protein ABG79_00637 [Caloramator mitchellensis]|uniref:DUF5050 domain-containing protein n=1 Tax=Caloramator mitchellensis TaxID=908809 RepID=A0A0R3JWD0_CALMK|nr:DUF5050 domain-containing protein [Caloramator mitchellensis]KRQ87832.1 hypothetical protein ABG79_00637 [Caloramator mitchellensis]